MVEWYLKEIGHPAEVVNLNLKEKEHRSPEFLKVNPFGKVPAAEDGECKLFESGAILLYIADKYDGYSTPEKRGRAAQWILFANSTLFDAVFVEAFRERWMPDVMGNLNNYLSDKQWLEGDDFTVADVAMGSYLLYIPAFCPQVDLSPWPNVVKYMDRCAKRPACAATVVAPRPGQQSQDQKQTAVA
eukprot:jgi/Chrzof1/3377/Cz12g23060.t1